MNPKMTFSPAHQVQPTHYPDPGINRPPGPYYNSGPMPPQMTPSPAHHFRPMYSPDPRMYQRPQNSYYSSPTHHVRPPYSPDPRMYHQTPRGSHYNSGSRNPSTTVSPYPPFPPQGQSGNFQTQGPYQKPFDNTHNSSFKGKSQQRFSGLGKCGKRGGPGSHEIESAEIRPDKYYNKYMVEDPWKDLKPSIWKTEGSYEKKFNSYSGATTSSLPDSSRTKKPRVSGSQPSLAEFLAAAFSETVGEKGDSESMPYPTTFLHPDSVEMENPRLSEASEESGSQTSPAECLAASNKETVGEKGDGQGSSL